MIKSFLRNLRESAYYVFGAAIGPSAILAANLYVNHNIDYTIGEDRILRKVDGFVSSTTVTIFSGENVRITRNHPFSYRSYYDQNGGDSLDAVYLGGNIFGRGIKRENISLDRDGLETHPDILASSEREFREQLKRFGLSPNI